jgi:uncharacterized protein YceK
MKTISMIILAGILLAGCGSLKIGQQQQYGNYCGR